MKSPDTSYPSGNRDNGSEISRKINRVQDASISELLSVLHDVTSRQRKDKRDEELINNAFCCRGVDFAHQKIFKLMPAGCHVLQAWLTKDDQDIPSSVHVALRLCKNPNDLQQFKSKFEEGSQASLYYDTMEYGMQNVIIKIPLQELSVFEQKQKQEIQDIQTTVQHTTEKIT